MIGVSRAGAHERPPTAAAMAALHAPEVVAAARAG